MKRIVSLYLAITILISLFIPMMNVYAYNGQLVCGLEEAHIHTESCYEEIERLTDSGKVEIEYELVCGLLTAHTHDNSCYDDNGDLVCELEEHPEHIHSDRCYKRFKDSGNSIKNNFNNGMNNILAGDEVDTHINLGGEEYPIDEFQSMSDFLIAAQIISDGVSYDLMAGDKISGINIYKDLEMVLNLRFQTSTSGSELNKLYFWEIAGISLDEPVVGKLENSEGEVYGDYYITEEGIIYAVLDENGLTQSIIDWNIKFDALWERTEGGTVVIDLGNGNTVDIELDLSRFGLLKQSEWVEYEDTVKMAWDVAVSAYDTISISEISDSLSVRRYLEMTEQYIKDNGLENCADLLEFTDFKLEYTNESGEYIELDIPVEDVQFIEKNEKLEIEFIYDLEPSIVVPAGNELNLSYDVILDKDFYIYCMLYDVDMYRFDNYVTVEVDGEYETADSYIQYSGKDLIKKVKNGLDSSGYMDWCLILGDENLVSLTGMMVQDKLLTDVDYVLEDSFYYYYDEEHGGSESLDVIICDTQEEFDSIVEAPTGISPVFIYEREFKWFIPNFDNGTRYIELYYKTSVNDELLDEDSDVTYNEAKISSQFDDLFDYGDDGDALAVSKTNDGIHIDSETGKKYTNWTLEIDVNSETYLEWLHIEEYMPHSGDLIDTIVNFKEFKVYTKEEAEENNFIIKITNKENTDITDSMLGYLEVKKHTDEDNLYIINIGDKNAVNDDNRHGGFDEYDFDYTISLTFPAYLEGDTYSFYEHVNSIDVYYTREYAHLDAESILNLPHIDNSELYTKNIIDETLSEDGKTLTLTYDVRYNMGDITTGLGYTFKDQLESTEYTKYRQGSLGVYWVDKPMEEDYNTYSYHIKGSQYFGETNLLEINEDVEYRIDSDYNYDTFRMATLISESESGWECYVPYYKRTDGFEYTNEEDSSRFYSPRFIYKVDVDVEKLEENSIYSLDVKNTASVYLRDGSLDAIANSTYRYRNGALQKNMIQEPVSDNQYTAKYELIVNAAHNKVKDFERLDIIDEMSSSMNLVADSIVVEVSDNNETYEKLDESKYRLLYDGNNHRLTVSIDNSAFRNYYKILYDVQISGIAGSTINIYNKAYISGFSEGSTDVSNVVTISESSGSAEGAVAKLKIKKYNADNLKMNLEGAKFTLERVGALTSEQLEHLNSLETQEDILEYIDSNNLWIDIDQKTTDSSGEIQWENSVSGIVLPLDSLYKLTETEAPNGYVLDSSPRYFYLSADNGATAERNGLYVSKFDVLNYDSTIFVDNQRGAFSLLKIGSDINEPLSGAVFGLFSDETCNNLVMQSIDYDDGTYYFGDLDFNSTYYLKEISAPMGYKVDIKVYTIKISDTGAISISPDLKYNGDEQYIFVNDLEGTFRLPDTGSNSKMQNNYIGFMVVMLGTIVWFTGTHKKIEE